MQCAHVQADVCLYVGEEGDRQSAYYEVGEVGKHKHGGEVYEISEV